MAYTQDFNTKWVNELPRIGFECPLCQKGIPEDNSFTGKDSREWKSVKCMTCRTKWIITQRTPKKVEVQRPEEKDFHEEDVVSAGDLAGVYEELKKLAEGNKEILGGLREVWVELEKIHKDIRIGE